MREALASLSSAVTIAIAISALLWHSALPTYGMPVSDEIANHNNSLYARDIVRIAKAAEIRNYMNDNIDPCDDFYEFACGNWAKINPASPTESTGLFELLAKAFNQKIQNLLKNKEDPHYTNADIKVIEFYKSCTEMGNGDAYREKLLEIVEEFGGMPAISGDNWNENNFDWLETIAKIAHIYDIGIIMEIDFTPDFQNTLVNGVYIGHPHFELETREMYVDVENLVQRKAYEVKIAENLSKRLSLNQALANKVAKEIVDFEAALARGMGDTKKVVGKSELFVPTTVAELIQKYQNDIDIWKLITIRFSEEVNGPVYEYSAEYQRNLIEVLKVTPKTIVANYIAYSLLKHFWLETADTQTELNRNCISKTKTYFAKNLDNMIYRRYNTPATARDVNMIWKEIKQTFKEELESDKLHWLSYEVRRYAVEKLNAIQLEINSYMNDNFTEELNNLVIYPNDYIKNIENILRHNSRTNIAKFHRKSKFGDSETFSYTPVNSLFENKIKVPVAILQPYYLWAPSYPSALKFGNLGVFIGRELIHAFDDTGRMHDIYGDIVNWWDEQSSESFRNRTECFIDQYSKYYYNGVPLPRSNLQLENIADNGGVRIAYQSYIKWLALLKEREDEFYLEKLPKLDFTNKQIFFISWAQIWCNDGHPNMRTLQNTTDTPVPGKYRVNGPLSNFLDFAKEFNCSSDSFMNRNEKCEIY